VTSVGVVIPWYQKGPDPWRERALAHVRAWWDTAFPGRVVLGTISSDDGPWRKGLAVHRGIAELDAEIVVVSDADVICEGVDDAIAQISRFDVGWAIPHRMVCRLTADATTMLLQDNTYPPTPTRTGVTGPHYAEVYPGAPGGGLVVLPRRLLEDVPIDPRFCGWGQEDYAWARALTMIAGHPWRGRFPLFHLFHEPQQRMSRGIGSSDSHRLWQRYHTAPNLPVMLDLIEEARKALHTTTEKTLSDPLATI